MRVGVGVPGGHQTVFDAAEHDAGHGRDHVVGVKCLEQFGTRFAFAVAALAVFLQKGNDIFVIGHVGVGGQIAVGLSGNLAARSGCFCQLGRLAFQETFECVGQIVLPLVVYAAAKPLAVDLPAIDDLGCIVSVARVEHDNARRGGQAELLVPGRIGVVLKNRERQLGVDRVFGDLSQVIYAIRKQGDQLDVVGKVLGLQFVERRRQSLGERADGRKK